MIKKEANENLPPFSNGQITILYCKVCVKRQKRKRQMNKKNIFLWGGILGFFLLSLVSLMTGAVPIPAKTILSAIFSYSKEDSIQLLVREIRIPRLFSSIMVGAALACAGASMQAVTHNPMADSGLMGLTSGAGLFLAITYIVAQNISYAGILFATFLGAVFGVSIVLLITKVIPGGNAAAKMILAGAAVSTFFSAISQAIALVTGRSQSMMFWTMGSVSKASFDQVKVAAPIVGIALLFLFLLSPAISAMSLGDEVAKSIGVHTKRTYLLVLLCVTILSGISFTICGNITFIGIMIPHFVKFFVGSDFKRILPYSMLFGANLVLVADILAKEINPPTEIPIGAVISTVGAIAFLYFGRKELGKRI